MMVSDIYKARAVDNSERAREPESQRAREPESQRAGEQESERAVVCDGRRW
jgi:hypothetical protein